MTLAEIEELRQKGWKFNFNGDHEGWMCYVVGRLAHGDATAPTLEEAAEWAMQAARSMEDDPEVLIKNHGQDLEKLAKKIFGEGVFKGIEPVESPEGEPIRIAISVEPKVEPRAYVDDEVVFIQQMMKQFPKEVYRAVVLEVDWPEEKTK